MTQRDSGLWLNPPSAEDLVLRRKPVSSLNETLLEEIVSDSVFFIRNKDIQGLLGLFSPVLTVETCELDNGRKVNVTQNRDGFEIGLLGWLEGWDTSRYVMEVESISIDDDKGKIEVVVYHPGDRMFREFYGDYVRETLEVGMYKSIPVIEKIRMHVDDA